MFFSVVSSIRNVANPGVQARETCLISNMWGEGLAARRSNGSIYVMTADCRQGCSRRHAKQACLRQHAKRVSVDVPK